MPTLAAQVTLKSMKLESALLHSRRDRYLHCQHPTWMLLVTSAAPLLIQLLANALVGGQQRMTLSAWVVAAMRATWKKLCLQPGTTAAAETIGE